jgi:hypothetical protein
MMDGPPASARIYVASTTQIIAGVALRGMSAQHNFLRNITGAMLSNT